MSGAGGARLHLRTSASWGRAGGPVGAAPSAAVLLGASSALLLATARRRPHERGGPCAGSGPDPGAALSPAQTSSSHLCPGVAFRTGPVSRSRPLHAGARVGFPSTWRSPTARRPGGGPRRYRLLCDHAPPSGRRVVALWEVEGRPAPCPPHRTGTLLRSGGFPETCRPARARALRCERGPWTQRPADIEAVSSPERRRWRPSTRRRPASLR